MKRSMFRIDIYKLDLVLLGILCGLRQSLLNLHLSSSNLEYTPFQTTVFCLVLRLQNENKNIYPTQT